LYYLFGLDLHLGKNLGMLRDRVNPFSESVEFFLGRHAHNFIRDATYCKKNYIFHGFNRLRGATYKGCRKSMRQWGSMPPKNAAAVALGRKGGHARAKKLTAEQRSESARKAVQARWQKTLDQLEAKIDAREKKEQHAGGRGSRSVRKKKQGE
jgi:hypothetical protein